MLADEAHTKQGSPSEYGAGNFGLTILATDLSWKGNDDLDSQGHYDYQAHAHVLPGGADPLESQGYASAISNPSKALRRGPRSQKLAGVFVYGRSIGVGSRKRIL
jgi:hypothetical protein